MDAPTALAAVTTPPPERPRTMDDYELVRQASAGDDRAFEMLVAHHADAAWRMARSMLRDDFTAEEAIQDTFLKAYRNLHSFRGEAKVSTWLLSICHRVCIDRLRLKAHRIVSLDEVHQERGWEEHRWEDRTDLRMALEEALARLEDNERDAFTLVEIVGHTREEAAEIVGVPASTMRSRVARAREKLAKALGEARREATGS